jgi:thiamine transporter ThiT
MLNSKMSNVKRSTYAAVCIALCVVLPMAFHMIQNAGNIFLPMHIPVLLCGLICGWPYGLLCAIFGPLLSNLLTGMPPAAYLPYMIVEVSVYGAATGILMKHIHTKNTCADIYISMVLALLLGRVISGAVKYFMFAPGSYSMKIWVIGNFVTCIPGILFQLILVPAIVFALIKAKLIPGRY